ncbi:MAG: hypothetical protein KF722_18825 [Nitrospira sp.]|nr:hypothetical protein [Nitrospira sp.]
MTPATAKGVGSLFLMETVHCRDCSFMVIEPRKDPTAGIVDVRHQDTARTAPLEPVMMRPIELDQLAAVGFMQVREMLQKLPLMKQGGEAYFLSPLQQLGRFRAHAFARH